MTSHLFIVGSEQRVHGNPQPVKLFIYKKQHSFAYLGTNFGPINITLCVRVVETGLGNALNRIFLEVPGLFISSRQTFSCVSVFLFRAGVQSTAVIRAGDRKSPREAFFHLRQGKMKREQAVRPPEFPERGKREAEEGLLDESFQETVGNSSLRGRRKERIRQQTDMSGEIE